MKSFYDHLLPVVVLYKQNLCQSLTLQSLQQNLEVSEMEMEVFIYDNSPDPQASRRTFSWKSFKVYYVHDPHNPGLSKAYNTAAVKAQALQKKWLLLLDQDTTFPADFLLTYSQAVKAYPNINLYAPILRLKDGKIFSPCVARHKRGYPPGNIKPGQHSLWKYSPVNSGMLVNLNLFLTVGGYNEKVKVDFCDFQFLEKVRKVSPYFFLCPVTGLQHYASLDPAVDKQLQRFKIYLNDALNCEKPRYADQIGFFYTVTRHALGLTLKQRNFSFLRMYFQYFLTGKG